MTDKSREQRLTAEQRRELYTMMGQRWNSGHDRLFQHIADWFDAALAAPQVSDEC